MLQKQTCALTFYKLHEISMMSIFPDVRKVKNGCFLANVNDDGRDLKQIKKNVFNSIQKTGFWHVANEEWGEMKKRLGRGSR